MTDTKYSRSASVVFSEVEDETVLLHTDSDKAFGLDELATFTWDQMSDDGKTLDELVTAIVAEYDVEQERASQDTQQLLDHLLRENLISCTNP